MRYFRGIVIFIFLMIGAMPIFAAQNCNSACATEAVEYAYLSQHVSTVKNNESKNNIGYGYDLVWSRKDGYFADGFGLRMAAYSKAGTNKLVVAYAGTEPIRNFGADIITNVVQFIRGPEFVDQYRLAKNLTLNIKSNNIFSSIILTGHSLGGGIASYVSDELHFPAYIFNPARIAGGSSTRIKAYRSKNNKNNIPTRDFVSVSLHWQLAYPEYDVGLPNGVIEGPLGVWDVVGAWASGIINTYRMHIMKHIFNALKDLAENKPPTPREVLPIATQNTILATNTPILSYPNGNIIQQNVKFGAPNGLLTLHIRKKDSSEKWTDKCGGTTTTLCRFDSSGSKTFNYRPSAAKQFGTYYWWVEDHTTGYISNESSYYITDNNSPDPWGGYYGKQSRDPLDNPPPGCLPDFVAKKAWMARSSSSSLSYEKYEFEVGDTAYAHVNIKNEGCADSPQNIDVWFMGNHGEKEDSHSDTRSWYWDKVAENRIKEGNLKKGDTKHEWGSFTVPNTPGKYNIVACADRIAEKGNGHGEVLEEHKSNDCSEETVFTVIPKRKPNLTALLPAIELNHLLTVKASALNTGNKTSSHSYLRFYRSADSTITRADTQFAAHSISGLAPNQASLQSAVLNLTEADLGLVFWIGVCVDNVTNETSYADNCSVGVKVIPTIENIGATNDIKPVYGFWNPDVTGHHMTISESERNSLIDRFNKGEWNWRYEGVYFYALPKKINNAVPVYQLWKTGIGHHYTRSSSERGSLLSSGWIEGHAAFYAYPSKRPGTVPVYRYYNRNSTDHFFPRTAPSHYNANCNYTGASLNGKNALNSTNYNHCYEGIGWYAYSSAPKKPSVVTYNADKITQKSVNLKAAVNPQGTTTILHFDYGETSSYGSTLTYGSIGSGSSVIVREKTLGGLDCGKTYQYRARAINDGGFTLGENKTINMPNCIPVIPTAPKATDGTYQDKVRISWNSVSGAINYRIFRCTNATTSSCKILSTVSGSLYDDKGAKAGTTYYYRLAACNNGGCSNASSYDTGFAAISNYTLSVAKSGNGTVMSNPTGINCGTDCSQSYKRDTSITLTAKPAKGWYFVGWGGSCSGTSTCVVNMSENKNISAIFSSDSLTNKPNIITILSLLLLTDENEINNEKYRADVNGNNNIDLGDVVLIQRYASGMDMAGTGWVFTPITGDVNCDGKTDIFDATLVQRYGSGLDMAGTGWCVNLL